ncbi:hypothetical protein M2132_002443 [Dysgonomonas sp. PH5-45]|uniref:hypothetical protein n=1 Tax=unclassified Dysgonomonas TaxID=2630389 RepID=UPI002473F0D1|nr:MULTISPECIES: hypothetical protein [unclassified Dysgonomonas]MDH6356080.1 hypothetical protein [Dysgonomonas sp. PH5-45]MDH6388967.1 hypothetical protein [Dysgonomonas sp. PH5-37]
MLKKKLREKHIGENKLENFTLIPNKSLGVFILRDDIENYLYIEHIKEHIKERTFSYDSYDFYDRKVTVWPTEGKIETIRCNSMCYLNGENLIGMSYERFLILVNQFPDTESEEYVLINSNRGQNQKVYDFDELGLQIWVWRNKIRTVLISSYEGL